MGPCRHRPLPRMHRALRTIRSPRPSPRRCRPMAALLRRVRTLVLGCHGTALPRHPMVRPRRRRPYGRGRPMLRRRRNRTRRCRIRRHRTTTTRRRRRPMGARPPCRTVPLQRPAKVLRLLRVLAPTPRPAPTVLLQRPATDLWQAPLPDPTPHLAPTRWSLVQRWPCPWIPMHHWRRRTLLKPRRLRRFISRTCCR